MEPEYALKNIIGGHNIPYNILYKHSFLTDNKLTFREHLIYFEDGPFLMELFSKKPKALYINDETYVYRLGAEGSVTNTSLNASKVKSLIDGASIYMGLRNIFVSDGEIERKKMLSLYQIGALKGIMYLDDKEAKHMFKYLRQQISKIELDMLYGKDKVLGIIYNYTKDLAFYVLRSKLLRK